MKIQTLNEKQRKKLAKLIKEFFPELHSSQVDDYYGDFMVTLNTFSGNKSSCEGFYEEKIHWYQLCLTELPKKIHKLVEKIIDAVSAGACLGG